MSRRVRTGALAAVATVVLAAFGAAPAGADTEVKVQGNVLIIESGLVQENDITVTRDTNSNIFRVTEAAGGPRVDAGSGCARPHSRQASCPLAPGGTVRVDLKGGLLDKYNGVGLSFSQTVDGGSGTDRVSTGTGGDTLNGGLGLDHLDGGVGGDRLNGGSGDDFLDGGPGGDTLSGGSGSDMVEYQDFVQDVTVDLLAGFASVSGQAVRDTVFGDVEDIRAGLGSDTLTGDQGDNRLVGQSSVTSPSERPDTLTGLGGDDVINAGFNRARDNVSCGAGDDLIELDLTDVAVANPMLADCETVQVRAVDQHPAVTIRKRRARVAGGTILVPLRCSRKSRRRCSGTLSVRRRGGARLGRAVRYRIGRGRGRTVRVPLSRTGRRLVARRGRLRAEMTARERDPKGRPKLTVARFQLRGS